MKIFLETSVLSDVSLLRLTEELLRRSLRDEFYISALTHFEILLGYVTARRSSVRYEDFLRSLKIEVVPLTKTDSEEASTMIPSKKDIVDSLVAAAVNRYRAVLWTKDSDFLKFLSKDNVRLMN